MSQDHIQNMRNNYEQGALNENDLAADPLVQFKKWFEEAVAHDIYEANAMTLATCVDDKPSVRTVLLKEIDEGVVFYTNYGSRKGEEIEQNPNVAVLFFWKELERQVRIEGTLEKVSEEQSKEYFHKRPKSSQIAAWASPQSEVINDRYELEDRVAELEDVYAEVPAVPLPAHWGGYRLLADHYEFWQGRKSRLHDRLVYDLNEEGEWEVFRLAP